MFFLNYLLIGAVSASLFNFVNLLRGVLLAKKDGAKGKLILLEALYAICFAVSLLFTPKTFFEIFLSSLTCFTLMSMTVFMWKGNGKHIRYYQCALVSPAWLVYNVFHFTLGGILCEAFNILSVLVSFLRYGKEGFEK